MEYDLFEYAYQEEKRKDMSEPNTLEIIIKEKKVGLLDWNFAELKKALAERLKSYANVVYDETQIGMAKKDRALLNGLKKDINSRKLEIKKEFCAPYLEFEANAKELMAMIDECASGIDEQVKAYEEKERTAKRNRINDWWVMNKPTNMPVKIEQVMDEKWLNKSVTDKAWQKALTERRDEIIRNLDTVCSWTDEDKRDYCLRHYLNNLDFGKTMAMYEQVMADRAKIEELKAEAERKRQEAEQNRIEAEQEAVQSSADQSDPDPEVKKELWDITMQVIGDREMMVDLANFMKSRGIWFKRIKAGIREEN